MNRVMTTGQVARVFSVNINTVIKWFDEGKLEGFRLPRSNERRIYRESVMAFMRAHNINEALLAKFEEEQDGRKRRRKRSGPIVPVVTSAGGAENRRFPRLPVQLEGRILPVAGEEPLGQVVVRNLSMGGAYLTGFRAETGAIPAEFRLAVPAENGHPAFDGVCQLIHLRRDADASHSFGCRFTRVDPGTIQLYLS